MVLYLSHSFVIVNGFYDCRIHKVLDLSSCIAWSHLKPLVSFDIIFVTDLSQVVD